jgi:hypothetical protein
VRDHRHTELACVYGHRFAVPTALSMELLGASAFSEEQPVVGRSVGSRPARETCRSYSASQRVSYSWQDRQRSAVRVRRRRGRRRRRSTWPSPFGLGWRVGSGERGSPEARLKALTAVAAEPSAAR